MTQKPFTVASYAAGAGLAAIALVYVFAPTFFIDESDYRKKGAIGLINVGNDCFINSNLQSLAGLNELRIFLIRETYRRTVDGDSVYDTLLVQPEPASSGDTGSPSAPLSSTEVIPEWKLRGLQKGLASGALKTMLDKLNERPIARKTLSQRDFIRVLEMSFGQTINRQQQDAQEFLQLVFERLKDEYSAGQRVHREILRRQAAISESQSESDLGLPEPTTPSTASTHANGKEKQKEDQGALPLTETPVHQPNGQSSMDQWPNEANSQNRDGAAANQPNQETPDPFADEPGFPMDGERESHLTCQTCNYSTSARSEPFTMLTLSVPQVSSTTLATCFEKAFAPEYISDFKCEKCRLVNAVDLLRQHINHPKNSAKSKSHAEANMKKLLEAIDKDPEHPPPDVPLPDISLAPVRTITRKTRISKYPRVLVVHLSRSIYDRVSQKNTAKVSFPESLVLGGLGNPKNYRLNSVIIHRGGHTSGHYESFRRQCVSAPFSNPNRALAESAFSRALSSPNPSNLPTTPNPAPSSPSSSQAGTPVATLTPLPDPLSSMASLASTLPSDRPSSVTHVSPDTTTTIAQQPQDEDQSQAPPLLPTNDKQACSSSSPYASDSSSIRSLAKSVLSRKSSRLSTRLRATTSPKKPQTGVRPDENEDSGTRPVTPDAPTHAQPTKRRKRKSNDKWWRISDEKCRQAKTSDVLGMQREVYMLFYELDRKHLNHV
ncbi:Ubiquitin carboxyl-terminal hydrolase 16 [Ceratocystis lukuohia]|uniref:Ubiquitin carboxyl-terminal hydrolase n=1 Tax=Ceratocystis lukuohia TaxID=2019550 RepID=A0ABR4MHA9_9PEZI